MAENGKAKERREARRLARAEIKAEVSQMTPAEVRSEIAELTKGRGGARRLTKKLQARFKG